MTAGSTCSSPVVETLVPVKYKSGPGEINPSESALLDRAVLDASATTNDTADLVRRVTCAARDLRLVGIDLERKRTQTRGCSSVNIARRPASPADCNFIRTTHHSAYHDLVVRVHGSWDESRQDEFVKATHSDGTVIEIILCDGVAVGYCVIEDRADDVHVRELVVVPWWQGQGVGSTILQQAMDRARHRLVPVRLQTHIVNRAAGLYRRMGFREMGQSTSHLLFEWDPGTAEPSS